MAPLLPIIVNPTAGPGRRRPRPADLAARARAEGFHPHLLVTTQPGEATALAAAAARTADLVLVVGGDGTVHEAAAGLLGSPARLAVLPAGSGNDLAADLGLSGPEDGWRSLRGRVVKRDVGWWEDRPFFNSCGLFLSGDVSRRAARRSRRWGAGRYWLAAAAGIARHRPVPGRWELTAPAVETLEGAWSLAEIGVGRFTGGGFRLTPRADPTDGLLDLCLVAAHSRHRLLCLLPRGRSGNHLGAAGVHYRQAASLRCRLDAGTAIHLDGEAARLPAGSYRCRCQRGALAVMAPPRAGGAAGGGPLREETS